MSRSLHLISFDIPYPPVYGGIIDVFFKIKALSQQGVCIKLHCFQYGKAQQEELEKYCQTVHYYKRNSYFKSLISTDIPFIAKSRGNEDLISKLKEDNDPILFDGLHTTYILQMADFSDRNMFMRAHNVEHKFYSGLAKSESNIFKKKFYKQESKKLQKYEWIVSKMKNIFSISPLEQDYFLSKYGEKSVYVPAFHDDEIHTTHNKKGDFILYHGNVMVSENVNAATFLIDVYKNTEFQLVIASSYFNDVITKEILKYDNVSFHSLENSNDLYRLFENSHINVLPTFQNTGIKLKLLNTLYQGKFIIANDFMIDETGLESLCEKANTRLEFLEKTKKLYQKDFSKEIIDHRKEVLKKFSPAKSAKKIADIIFSS